MTGELCDDMGCEPDDGGEPILTGGWTFHCLYCDRKWIS